MRGARRLVTHALAVGGLAAAVLGVMGCDGPTDGSELSTSAVSNELPTCQLVCLDERSCSTSCTVYFTDGTMKNTTCAAGADTSVRLACAKDKTPTDPGGGGGLHDCTTFDGRGGNNASCHDAGPAKLVGQKPTLIPTNSKAHPNSPPLRRGVSFMAIPQESAKVGPGGACIPARCPCDRVVANIIAGSPAPWGVQFTPDCEQF
jgi:hypothetical protein